MMPPPPVGVGVGVLECGLAKSRKGIKTDQDPAEKREMLKEVQSFS